MRLARVNGPGRPGVRHLAGCWRTRRGLL